MSSLIGKEDGGLKVVFCIFALVCLALGIANMYLLKENGELKALAKARIQSNQLLPGMSVPALAGFDVEGKRISIDYGHDNRPTLLLVFSPTCGACDLNWPTWKHILAATDQRSFRIALVDSSSFLAPAYVRSHGLTGLRVFGQVDPDVWLAYKLGLTPQTILIDPYGRVERLWIGVIQGVRLTDLENALDLRSSRLNVESLSFGISTFVIPEGGLMSLKEVNRANAQCGFIAARCVNDSGGRSRRFLDSSGQRSSARAALA